MANPDILRIEKIATGVRITFADRDDSGREYTFDVAAGNKAKDAFAWAKTEATGWIAGAATRASKALADVAKAEDKAAKAEARATAAEERERAANERIAAKEGKSK